MANSSHLEMRRGFLTMRLLRKTLLFASAAATAFHVLLFPRSAFKVIERLHQKSPRNLQASLILFTALLSLTSCFEDSSPDEMTCYDIGPTKPTRIYDSSLQEAIIAAWRSLDERNISSFDAAVDKAAGQQGSFSKEAAGYMKLAFKELAEHRKMKAMNIRCYEPTAKGEYEYKSRKTLESQLLALDTATREGKLTPEVADKAKEAIAKELEILNTLQTCTFIDIYKPDGQKPSLAAKEAADEIIELQKASEAKPFKKDLP
jgi:hypothetical protein